MRVFLLLALALPSGAVRNKISAVELDSDAEISETQPASVTDTETTKYHIHRVGSKIADRYVLLKVLKNRPHGHGGPIEEGDALLESKESEDAPRGSRFIKGKKLGQGGYATAYLATDTSTNREVVMKILNNPDDLGAQQQTSDECDVMKSLQSGAYRDALGASRLMGCIENHITVGQSGLGSNQFLVLQYGGKALQKDVNLDVVEATKQIMQGVKYLASIGIAHRDLKPDNILVSYGHGGETIIKIIDFGLYTRNTYTEAKVACAGSSCLKLEMQIVNDRYQYVHVPTSCYSGKCLATPEASDDCGFDWSTSIRTAGDA